MNDAVWMQQALELAERGAYSTAPNPCVGCVLVRDNVCVGEGWHQKRGEPHAERLALADAGEQARGATCYVTLEPCCHHGYTPPCTEALIAAGVTRVVAAMSDPNPHVAGQGFAALRAAGISVSVGVMADAAAALNVGFISRMQRHRPYVRLKMAMSLDGRVAMASGESQWITGTTARQEVQHWRGKSDAILTGIGSVLADDPRLTIRNQDVMARCLGRRPRRIVLDSTLRTPPSSQLFEPSSLQHSPVDIIGCRFSPERAAALQAVGAAVHGLPADESSHSVALPALFTWLAEHEINMVWVEAGPCLAGALLQQGAVDQLILYMAGKILGHEAQGAFQIPNLTHLSQATECTIQSITPVGEDWRIEAILT